MSKRLVQIALAALFLAVFAMPSSAQTYTGRIDVTVVDGTGAVLPGVVVDLSGPQLDSSTSDSHGEAHFLALAPGTYTVTAKLEKFTDYKNTNVVVSAGVSVPLKAVMTIGGVSASTEVTAQTVPLLDTRKEAVSTNISLDELQKIPSSRDPWVVLQTVPGVIVDRVNVGGAESGQQSNYQAKGASAGDNTWNMDGIAITDMSALGSTPAYYDFDMFQEMNVTTGGADLTEATPGVALNFVLRSGTNQWRGSGRYYFENHDLQANNVSSTDAGQIASYNRIQQLLDYGAEGGGPLMKDKLFIQASAGETHPQLNIYTRCTSTPLPAGCVAPLAASNYGISATDATILQDYMTKASANISNNIRASFTFFDGNKVKNGRGASATHPEATTWNQTGPTRMYKGEVNLTPNKSTFVTVRYAHVTGGFSLTPIGGLNTPSYLDDNHVWQGSYEYYATNRPQDTLSADGSWFKGKQELKYGFGYRKASVTSNSTWPGGGIVSIYSGYPSMNAEVYRVFNTNTSATYTDAFGGDTITLDRMTFNVGVRWDRQAASLGVVTAPAQTADPQGLLPALSGAAASNAVVWNSITPRVGMTYAVDKDRKTLIRGSYSMFASQMNATQANVLGTVQYSYTYYTGIVDSNHNGVADPSEIAAAYAANHANFTGYSGFNLNNPSALSTPNQIGNYKTPMTYEGVAGVDHQLARDIAVSASYTYRRYTNFDWNPLQGVSGLTYTQAGTYVCSAAQAAIIGPCSVPYYNINAAASNNAAGTVFEVRPGYYRTYSGLELSMTKRMSHNWMARAGFSTNSAKEYFSGLQSEGDPTASPASPNINGGDLTTQTAGSGKSNIYLVLPKYQFIANMAYEMKGGITFGVNYLGRQGYAEPYYASKVATGDLRAASKTILLTSTTDEFRLPFENSLDLRVGKEVKMNKATLNFDADFFNVLNLATTLGLQYDLRTSLIAAGQSNQILEIMNPRIMRLGVRVSF